MSDREEVLLGVALDTTYATVAGPPIRTGDSVKHGPSGETWQVAWADYERGEISWVGWPDGCAKLADVTLVERCSDDKHRDLVRSLRILGPNDNGSASVKGSGVRKLYGDEHRLKTWPRFFEAVQGGKKTFEIRKLDGTRRFLVGDFLRLVEWEKEKNEATGREMRVRVTFLTTIAERRDWSFDSDTVHVEGDMLFAVMAIVPDEESP